MNHKSRLLLVARSYPPLVGGMERYSHDLYHSLREIMDVQLVEHHRSRLLLPLFALKTLAFIAARRTRYTHIHFCDGALAPLALVARFLTGARVSITIHALDIIYDRWLYQFLVPPCVRLLDRVVCVSRFTMEECVRRGVDANRCSVIPNGISTTDAAPAPPGFIEERIGRLPEGSVLLVSVSRLIRRKGVAWFIDQVMPRLPAHYIYIVAGAGSERGAIEQAIVRRGLLGRVFLFGKITESGKLALIERARWYVMPNIQVPGDAEGFGISIIEAGARGLGCVAARVDGIPDAVIEGRSGVLVPAGDAAAFVTAILQARFSQEEVRRAVAEHFDWKVLRERYRELFTVGTGVE